MKRGFCFLAILFSATLAPRAIAEQTNVLTTRYHVGAACNDYWTYEKDHMSKPSAAGSSRTVRLPPRFMIAHLMDEYKITARIQDLMDDSLNAEARTPTEIFRRRIRAGACQESNDGTLSTGSKCTYPIDVQFGKKDTSALKSRQALVRIFSEASPHMSKPEIERRQSSDNLVVRRPTPAGQADLDSPYPEFPATGTTNWLSAQQSAWLSNYIDDEGPVDIYCLKREPIPSRNSIARLPTNLATRGVETTDKTIVRLADGKDSTKQRKADKPPKPKLMVVKDSEQFSASKPKGAKLGVKLGGDQDNENLEAEGAIGWVFKRSDKSISKKPWCGDDKDSADDPADCRQATDGSQRTYSMYLAYSQSPASIDILDDRNIFFTNDEGRTLPLLTERDIASGVLTGGLRLDYEDFRAYAAPDKRQHFYNTYGRRAPGHKGSFAVEMFTDNFFDTLGNRAEISFSPSQSYVPPIPGYRRPSRLFKLDGAVFSWDIAWLFDYVDYARQPKDRNFDIENFGTDDFSEIPRREDFKEFFRSGAKFEAKIEGRAPFSLVGSNQWWALTYEHTDFGDVGDNGASAATDKISFKLRDLYSKSWNVGISYTNSENELNFTESEFVGIELEWAQK